MPQAILTKFLPCTDKRGSRIKAICDRGSLTIGYPHEFNGDAAHRAAALSLVNKFADEDEKRDASEPDRYKTPRERNPWLRPFVSGGLPGGDCCHVFVD